MTRIKICGCRTPQDALVAAEAGADFVGIMFAESRRRVGVDDASEIVRALGSPLASVEMTTPPSLFRTDLTDARSWYEHGASALERMLARKRPLTVGVFANNDPDEIDEIVDETGIDLIQLSGHEPWSACLLANRQVIKVVHVAEADTSNDLRARIETGSAIAVMLDRAVSAPTASGGGSIFGGNGTGLDWSIAAELAATMPVWLAGGLSADNVAKAIASVQPWCVDVSSSLETDGIKDHAKIRALLRAARTES